MQLLNPQNPTCRIHGRSYVTTRYGARPLEEVKRDIATWLDTEQGRGFGSVVQGIWVDNVNSTIDLASADPEVQKTNAYYAEIAKLIRSYGKIVALNPGGWRLRLLVWPSSQAAAAAAAGGGCGGGASSSTPTDAFSVSSLARTCIPALCADQTAIFPPLAAPRCELQGLRVPEDLRGQLRQQL